MNLIGRLKAYPANGDARVAACNMIAMVVAWNQPFYPFYLHWFVGSGAWTVCWTFLSTPFFVAVPFVSRRHALAGRALLPLAGIGNMVVSDWALGEASGVWLFVIPCVAIPTLAFRRSERLATFAVIGIALAAFAFIRTARFVPAASFVIPAYERLFRLNAYSVAILTVFVGWSFRKTLRD